MSRILSLLGIGIALVIFLWACDNTDEVIVDPPLVVGITSVIDMTSFEKIEAGSTSLEFRCLTQDNFPCGNYVIDFLLNISIDSVDLNFTEITRPQICLSSTDKAFGIVILGALANNTYEFPISANNDTVMAQLVVTDSTFEIKSGNGTWTNILRDTLRRIPDDIIWGQVGYNNAIDLGMANTYFDSLNNLGAVPGTLSTGSYGYFFIDNMSQADSIIELGPTIGTTFRIPYVYHYTGDTTMLHNLIDNFASQGNIVEVHVITHEGYEYRSW